MEKQIAENIFLVMFSISLGFATNNAFKSIMPKGFGHYIRDGKTSFAIRISFMSVMVILSAICCLIAFSFCRSIESKGSFTDLMNLLIIILFATSPWLCDHIARICFLPFKKLVVIREKDFKGVDVVFVLVYIAAVILLFLLKKLGHLVNL
jgi:fatty acid desaturase